MTIEAEGLDELLAALAASPARVRAALRPGIGDATTLIAKQIEANASWSSYIPGAVSESLSTRASGVSGVIRIAERGFPHGGEVRVFEGNGISPTAFEQPVYGRGGFVTKMTRPFAGPAVIEEGPAAVAAVDAAVSSALQSLFA